MAIVLTIVVAGFFTSLAFHYHSAAVQGRSYPLSTFLFRPADQFNDYFGNAGNAVRILAIGKPESVVSPGMPGPPMMVYAVVLYRLFYPDAMKIGWALMTGGFLVAAIYLVQRTVRVVAPAAAWGITLALTLFAYPTLISIDRSNFEMVIFVVLAVSIAAYTRGFYSLAAMALGAVICAKPYAVVFLPLFFSDGRFKEMFIAAGTAAGLTLSCLLVLPSEVSDTLAYLNASLAAYNEIYVKGHEGLYFGSSLYGLLKVLAFSSKTVIAEPSQGAAFVAQLVRFYFYFSAAFYLMIAALVCVLRMQLWKKVALFVCSMNLLPYVCADYRLMHFFIPMLLFIREPTRQPGDRFFAVVFGLLLIPTSYIHFVFDPAFHVAPYEVSDSVIVHPLLMLLMVGGIFVTVLRQPEMSATARRLQDVLAGMLRTRNPSG